MNTAIRLGKRERRCALGFVQRPPLAPGPEDKLSRATAFPANFYPRQTWAFFLSIRRLSSIAPSVLPFQSTGITTITVTAGGVVPTRSLISVYGRRGRRVARAMVVLSEDGDDGPFAGNEAKAYARDNAIMAEVP